MKPPLNLDSLQVDVTAASDAQIAQIVALVDALPDRGVADALIAPLRRRLALLRPHRPVSFTRLLFAPLDPLIVEAPAWRRGSLSVPRTALAPIAKAVRAVLEPEAEATDAEGRGGPIPPRRMAELAIAIWPRAAILLDNAGPPADWEEAAGLPGSDYPAIAATVAALLAVALEIETLAITGGAPEEEPVRIILGRTAPRGGEAVSATVAVMLARLSAPGMILTVGTEAAGSNPSPAIDYAIDYTLDRLQTAFDGDSAIAPDLTRAVRDSGRIADLLDHLGRGAALRPKRQRQLDRLRSAADAMCQQRFAAAMQQELLHRLHHAPPGRPDTWVAALENEARWLRHFAAGASRFGAKDEYDLQLAECQNHVQHATAVLGLVERVRLTEILLGTQQAMALLP